MSAKKGKGGGKGGPPPPSDAELLARCEADILSLQLQLQNKSLEVGGQPAVGRAPSACPIHPG